MYMYICIHICIYIWYMQGLASAEAFERHGLWVSAMVLVDDMRLRGRQQHAQPIDLDFERIFSYIHVYVYMRICLDAYTVIFMFILSKYTWHI